MYLSCNIKSDITFIINYLSQNCYNPQLKHFKAVKQVLYYLNNILNFNIIYKLYINY